MDLLYDVTDSPRLEFVSAVVRSYKSVLEWEKQRLALNKGLTLAVLGLSVGRRSMGGFPSKCIFQNSISAEYWTKISRA